MSRDHRKLDVFTLADELTVRVYQRLRMIDANVAGELEKYGDRVAAALAALRKSITWHLAPATPSGPSGPQDLKYTVPSWIAQR